MNKQLRALRVLLCKVPAHPREAAKRRYRRIFPRAARRASTVCTLRSVRIQTFTSSVVPVSSLARPFAGLRAAPAAAQDVAAPPYDVLSTEEARVLASGKRWSFLHVSKAEIDLPPGTDPHAREVYDKARANFVQMLAQRVLVRDPAPCYYAYRMTAAGVAQTGVVIAASVAAYESNRIRRHEHTRPDKEDDRVAQIEALEAQTGPMLAAYPAAPEIDALLAQACLGAPDCEAEVAGVLHQVWRIGGEREILAITAAFDRLPALYIADGHHRSAAAARVARKRRGVLSTRADASWERILTVAFPHDQMRILDYNRVVRDLRGMSALEFLMRVGGAFEVRQSSEPVRPVRPGEFGLYTRGHWYRLHIKPERVPAHDPVAQLDVSLLTTQLLTPILGITDLRTDKRIDFVGGARGLAELERRVDLGEMAAAFSLFPTRMEDLMAVADAGEVMPPKSTWFEPKLADGLVSLVLD
jgi:uncharacterized protein (DUF1015 family)